MFLKLVKLDLSGNKCRSLREKRRSSGVKYLFIHVSSLPSEVHTANHPLPSLPHLCILFPYTNSFHVLSNDILGVLYVHPQHPSTNIFPVPPLDMSTPSMFDLSGFISKTSCAVPLMYSLLTPSILIEDDVILPLIKKQTNRKIRKTQHNTEENTCVMIYINCVK